MSYFENLCNEIEEYANYLEEQDKELELETIAENLRYIVAILAGKLAEDRAAEAEKYDDIVPF